MGGGESVENNNEMQTFLVYTITLKGYGDVSGRRWVS